MADAAWYYEARSPGYPDSPSPPDNGDAALAVLAFFCLMSFAALAYERQHGWPNERRRCWVPHMQLRPRKEGAKRDEEDCCVCLEPLGDEAVELPCGHAFHAPCIERWVEVQPVCPHCRWAPPLAALLAPAPTAIML